MFSILQYDCGAYLLPMMCFKFIIKKQDSTYTIIDRSNEVDSRSNLQYFIKNRVKVVFSE